MSESWQRLGRVLAMALPVFFLLACQKPTQTEPVTPASQPKPAPAAETKTTTDTGAATASKCEARVERLKQAPRVDKASNLPKGPVVRSDEGPNKTEVVLFVPVAGGVVRHLLGDEGNPANAECDPSFHEEVQVDGGVVWVKWSTHAWDWSGSECRAVRTEWHHLFVDAKTGAALGNANVASEGAQGPLVTFDPKAMVVRVQGHGCDTSETLH